MSISDKQKIGDLCTLITSLGQDGGIMSPSIYDTAQCLRFCPPQEGADQILDWLAEQQMPDGGWGTTLRSHTRDIPTIAALLGFAANPTYAKSERVIGLGLQFLKHHHINWDPIVPEDLPVGMELILPKLLSEAQSMGLSIPQDHYQNLIPIYKQKIGYIQSMPLEKGAAPTFSWESWGEEADPKWLDDIGSVGNNPTATAYWAHLAKDKPELKEDRERALRYLASASKATRSGIKGLVPTAWPVNRFEQSFSLHTLLMAGLLDHPQLKHAVQAQSNDLRGAVRPDGVGFSDHFNPDGDDTAASLAVLCATGNSVSREVLDHFAYKSYFRAYKGELQASHSVTARALYALRYYDADTTAAEQYLLSHQLPSGAWPGDKWNISPYYGTCIATFALKDKRKQYEPQLQAVANFFVESQLENGSWGSLGVPSVVDTGYALISVLHLTNAGLISPDIFMAGQNWLNSQYVPQNLNVDHRWLNKQEFSVYKVDQAFQLAALVAKPDLVQPAESVYHVSINKSPEIRAN